MNQKFQNRRNKHYHTSDGLMWNSRSTAVVNHIWILHGSDYFVLLGKRGPNGDQPGKWNVPCGYIDWDEDLKGAMERELWEETGLDIQAELESGNCKILKEFSNQPWYVNTNPNSNRQNISLHVGLVLHAKEKPILHLDNIEPDEATEAIWMKWEDLASIKHDDWAFNHDVKINDFFKTVIRNL